MTPQILTEGLVGGAPFVIGGASLGMLLAAVCGGLLVVGRPIPAIGTAAAAGLPTLVMALVGWSGVSSGTEQGLGRAIASGLVAPVLVGVPAVLALFLCAAAGVKDEPRRWIGAVLGGAAVLAVTVVLVVEGQALDDSTVTGVRAAVCFGTGLMAVAALVSGGTNGPLAAAGATVAWASVVAAGESAARSLAEFLLLMNIGGQPVAQRTAIVEAFQATVIDPTLPYAWALVAIAAATCLVAVAMSAPDPRRVALSASGLVWLVGAALIMTVAHPSQRQMSEYAATLPSEAVSH